MFWSGDASTPLPASGCFHLMAETFKGWPLARGLRRKGRPRSFFLNISWTWLTTLLRKIHRNVVGNGGWEPADSLPPVVQRDGFCMVDK